MNGRTTKLGSVFGAALLALGALSAAGCPEDDGKSDGGGILDGIADQCQLNCPAKGIVQGNASISGYGAIDGFFRSVVNFNSVAKGASTDIDVELDGIQALFGISDAQAKAGLSAAIKAQLQARYQASVRVIATPARCSVDASIAAQASVDCQVQAECKGTPPMAQFECSGTCTVDVNASGSCDANADVRCEVTGPSVACQGQCNGTCSAKLDAAASCTGTCVGSCSGTCVGDTDSGAGCNGQCMGMCQGSCDVVLDASAMCSGTCNGSCEFTPPDAKCSANAKVSCDLKASAKAQCNGRCDGEFTPPTIMCDAAASCQATAKAEAKFQAKCTPPTVDVRLVVGGNLTGDAKLQAEAQAQFLLGELKLRLPRLSAAVARAKYVNAAGAELVGAGKVAVSGTISAFQKGEVDALAFYRISTCVPSQLDASASVITKASADLNAKLSEAAGVSDAFAMVM